MGKKYTIKPTVTFTTKESAVKVFDAVMKCFNELDPESGCTEWIGKNANESYVISWDEYMGTSYVCVKVLRKNNSDGFK